MLNNLNFSELSALKPAVKTVMIAKRNFRNIEIDALRNDIKSVCAGMTLCAGANARQAEKLVAMYELRLLKHAIVRPLLKKPSLDRHPE